MICTTTTSMNKKGPPIVARTTKCTRHTMGSPGQGDERSENGMFEDPLCNLSNSMAWILPIRAERCSRTHGRIYGHVRTDVLIYPLDNFITDATMRSSHGRPSGHRPRRRPSVLVCPLDNPVMEGSSSYSSSSLAICLMFINCQIFDPFVIQQVYHLF
jgi:hypothetical protein